MRSRKAAFFAVILFAAIPGVAAAQSSAQPSALDQAIDRIVAQEKAEMQMLHQYSPLVETYIQLVRPDQTLGSAPAGDKYYLGKANLAKGLDLQPLTNDKGAPNLKYTAGGLGTFLTMSMQFLPRGFLQMIYIDTTGFDKQHYKFEYVRREFLGEVRCLVFDVTPAKENERGRFEGRIWVEDHDFHIVRFNGAYQRPSKASYFFHFDSWRVFSGDNQWLPAYIYSEESDLRYGVARKLMFKAQVRLWGFDLNGVRVRREQELNKVMVEAKTPVRDQTNAGNDYSPIEEQRLWERQAEDNIADRMEKLGVLSSRGNVDKVLETVVNNLEVTNNLDIQPEMRCRVLMTSTLESFVIGHTIVLSRGLIDVLPDEASLATILAMELSHVVLGHKVDTKYAFFDRMLWDDQDTFRHFGFARTPEEEQSANEKALELLTKSPYKNQLDAARQFVQVLQTRSKEIPNLISPHLGDRVPINWAGSNTLSATATSVSQDGQSMPNPGVIFAALPLGGRLKFDPWDDQVELLKAKPVGIVAEREKMPFEITPFILYLTRDKISPTETATIATDTAGPVTDNRSPAGEPVVDAAKKAQ
jgi:peptidase M48-like protein